jgi:taurine--2-oxoglutarate transaminase
VPLGGVIVSDEIAHYFDDKMLYMGLTYYGHPLACAAGIATINVYKEEKLIENSKQLGEVLRQELEELKSKYEIVGDVRSIGLFSVIELVRDRETKEALGQDAMNAIRKYLLEAGLSTYINKNLVFVCPPLIISKGEMLGGLGIIQRALAEIEH